MEHLKNKQIMQIMMVIVIIMVLVLVVLIILRNNAPSDTTDNAKIINREGDDIWSKENLYPGKIVLSSAKDHYKVDEEFTVSVSIDTDNALTVGTDIIIEFDPNILEVKGFTNSDRFSTYPIQRAEGNVIYISALTEMGETLKGEIPICTINFIARNAGQTGLNIRFKLRSTTDSNIAEYRSTIDILGTVQNLNLIIEK